LIYYLGEPTEKKMRKNVEVVLLENNEEKTFNEKIINENNRKAEKI
jgi:hypothetical protein